MCIRIFLLGLLFIGIHASATPTALKLKMSLSVEGELIGKPTIIANLGETAYFSQIHKNTGKETFIEVTATQENASGPINLVINFGNIVNGEKQTLSKPQLNAMVGEEAAITQYGINGNEDYSISVVATKVRN